MQYSLDTVIIIKAHKASVSVVYNQIYVVCCFLRQHVQAGVLHAALLAVSHAVMATRCLTPLVLELVSD